MKQLNTVKLFVLIYIVTKFNDNYAFLYIN